MDIHIEVFIRTKRNLSPLCNIDTRGGRIAVHTCTEGNLGTREEVQLHVSGNIHAIVHGIGTGLEIHSHPTFPRIEHSGIGVHIVVSNLCTYLILLNRQGIGRHCGGIFTLCRKIGELARRGFQTGSLRGSTACILHGITHLCISGLTFYFSGVN